MEILLRVLLAIGLLLAGAVTYRVVSRWILGRARGRRLGLESIRPGVPAVLYFTTPTCGPCKTVQRPALQRVQQTFGKGLQIIEVDCTERPDLADYWGVLSVPTTFIIDAEGVPRRINHGVTREEKLMAQLVEIGAVPIPARQPVEAVVGDQI